MSPWCVGDLGNNDRYNSEHAILISLYPLFNPFFIWLAKMRLSQGRVDYHCKHELQRKEEVDMGGGNMQMSMFPLHLLLVSPSVMSQVFFGGGGWNHRHTDIAIELCICIFIYWGEWSVSDSHTHASHASSLILFQVPWTGRVALARELPMESKNLHGCSLN